MFEGLREYLKLHLPQKIIDGGYSNYEIFGKEAESPISSTIEEFLSTNGYIYTAKKAKDKNEFPDLEIVINGTKYALEHKAGICNNKGEVKRSPANDMGTINAYPTKIGKYSDNIYCTFVKYSVLDNDTINIEDVYFDKIYTFIGRGTGFDMQLQYREKDGNLRPKSWQDMADDVTYFATLPNFESALKGEFQVLCKL
ncbi:MAG: hypothetical protein GX567_17930 [Clostridia bacterium]|nr:hypothetical protein [Clostridia bacterium]